MAGAICVVDNRGVVNRARAILASTQGTPDKVPAFVIAAELLELLAWTPGVAAYQEEGNTQPRLTRRTTMPPTTGRRR